jgi:mannose-6-phosphate isomerase-like protein (cupin superfamily)
MTGIRTIPSSALERSNFSLQLQGKDCGEPGVSLILVEAPPGRGPSLHTHDYAEVMVFLEGTATLTDGGASHEVGGGDVVVVPAGQPHGFKNTGDVTLKQVNIHVADAFATEWL